MTIEKLISFHIEKQFPAIYREDGQELVQFVKEYYKFMETNENQSLYNGRRMFEYRDIDTTLDRMLLFYKNKYLSELPFDGETIRIVVKNILGLYRRKGTLEGLELFFTLFYNESIKVYYPSKNIFKPSDSEWKSGNYLQLSPNSGLFTSTKTNEIYTYADMIGKTIIGETSRARATVDKINFIILNNSFTPIIFVNDNTGQFIGSEGIICEIDGVPVNFGRMYGSFTSIDIDNNYKGMTGNNIGDLVTFQTSPDGFGAKGLVTGVSENFTGIVSYSVEDGGWGYSIGSTKLLVSNQIIFLDNEGSKFELLETLEDDLGNRGAVIGQNDISIGIRMEPGDEFVESNTVVISTVDRDVNVDIQDLSGETPIRIVPKNETSPGPLYPDTLNTADVIVGEIANEENVSLIFDIIGNFTDVTLDALNYNASPALIPMSGNTDPVTIDTALENAFDLTPVEIGTIVKFNNINPGTDYVNDVFATAFDTRLTLFTRRLQQITLEVMPATIGIGSEITQDGIGAKVLGLVDNTITVRPYTYYGFKSNTPIEFAGAEWNIISISIDFTSEIAGFNSIINADTEFAVGKITDVRIIDSGYGYIDKAIANVIDANGNIAAKGVISAKNQGSTGGFWSSLNSNINGYTKTLATDGVDEYFVSGKFIHDSNYYQEYSYEIQSKIGIERYEQPLKEITHVAGTKVFGKFDFEEELKIVLSSDISIEYSVAEI